MAWIMRAVARAALKHPWLLGGVGTALGLVGAVYSAFLYMNLRTDVEELLPTNARAIIDLNQVTSRLTSYESIVLLVFSKDKEASRRYLSDLAARIDEAKAANPKSAIASYEYRIDREIKWFTERRSLFIDLADLEKIRDFIRDRISYEKAMYNPLNIFAEASIPEPLLDFLGLQKKYSGKTEGFDHLPGGYYALPDESMRLMVIYQIGKGLTQGMRMKDELLEAMKPLDPKKYAADLETRWTGNVENMLEESAALVADLELSTIIVVFLVGFVMVAYYRAFWATMILNASLFVGTFWTFGIAYFAVGYLNANTAFLASIVIGNGVNFGVIFVARYLEERRNGHKHPEALEVSMVQSSTSTLTAALAAGTAYGSLMLTGFRGFNQFGLIGLIGMTLCWLSSYTILPAYFSAFDRVFGDRWVSLKAPKPVLSRWVARFVAKHSGLVAAVSMAGMIAAMLILPKARFGVIENDLSKLRDKASMETGAGSLYHYIDDVFKRSVSPNVLLPKNMEDLPKLAAYFRDIKEKQGPDGVVGAIQSLDDFVPKDQEAKIELLREIKRLLPPKLFYRLEPSYQKTIKELLDPGGFKPFTKKDLPELILGKFRENDGSVGKILLVDKKFDGTVDDRWRLSRFVETLREGVDKLSPGTPVAGQLAVSYDLFKSIETDGPMATAFAFGAVVLLVLILFRNLQASVQVISALLLGVTWLTGIMLGFNLKINFLNFVALPITFGIGVDYAVNVLYRYRELGPDHVVEVIETTGGAVMLASLTTIIGYGSLLIAGNQAFVSFGTLAVVGELTCVTAAVVSLPALLVFFSKRKQRKQQTTLDTAAAK